MKWLGAVFFWAVGIACFIAVPGGFGLLCLATFAIIALLWLALG